MDKAQFLIEQAYVERKEGNPSLALDLYQNAAEALRPLDEPLRLAHTIRHIADIQRGLNLSEQAHTNYAEALAIYRAQPLTSKLDLANTLRGFALLSQSIGDIPAASSMWTEARELYRAVAVQAGVEEADRRLTMMSTDR